MAARALIRADELRRWARVAREEGVTINGRVDPSGTVTINISVASVNHGEDGSDDFEARLNAFARK